MVWLIMWLVLYMLLSIGILTHNKADCPFQDFQDWVPSFAKYLTIFLLVCIVPILVVIDGIIYLFTGKCHDE